jgi:O-antigen ligase
MPDYQSSPLPPLASAAEKKSRAFKNREPRLHASLDRTSGGLLFFVVVFTPWAFGTTQDWSIWCMNGLGAVAGLLLAAKRLVRWSSGWQPARWDAPAERPTRGGRFLVRSLAVLTLLLLGYCILHAVNARAMYEAEDNTFEYFPCIPWLPHSYHRAATWSFFCNYFALALFFWAARDWLLIKSKLERQFQPAIYYVPDRLRLLLWLVCLNGGLLALESLVQRLTTDQLLWLMEPSIHKMAADQLGPYAYRSNGAQLLNLIWPMALGFWWVLHRGNRHQHFRSQAHHLLPGCALIMIAAVIVSLSRGALVAVIVCLSLLMLVLLADMRRERWQLKLLLGLVLASAPLLVIGPWAYRFASAGGDLEGSRISMWKTAWGLVPDHPWYGTGPGSFSAVYQMAPGFNPEIWYYQLHNDWLETLLTWGAVGFALLLLALFIVATRWHFRPGLPAHRVLYLSLCIALAGCLLHAVADFPLQIYSILFLFLLFCSILSCLSSPGAIRPAGGP